MDRQQAAADALAQRLAMTISLQAVPMVEEWMDDKLAHWLESVPAPMEMPSDAHCELAVEFDSDLQRLTWSSLGTPAALIPKLARYLESSGAQSGDLDRINALGEAFEPRSIGSWIRVVPGTVETGWCFEHVFERQALREVLEPAAAVGDAFDQLAALGIGAIVRVEGTLARPAMGISCVLGSGWSDAFTKLVTRIDPNARADGLIEFFEARSLRDPRCRIDLDGGAISGVALVAPASSADDIAALCNAVGVAHSVQSGTLRRALGAGRSVELIAGCGHHGSFIAAKVTPGTESSSPSAAN